MCRFEVGVLGYQSVVLLAVSCRNVWKEIQSPDSEQNGPVNGALPFNESNHMK